MSKTAGFDKKAYKQKYKKPQGPTWPIYRRLLSYGRAYWLAFMMAVIANAAYAGIDSLFVYLMKPLLDQGFVRPDDHFIRWVPLVAVGLFGLRAFASLAASYGMGYVGRQVVLALRQQIFQHLMRLPCSFYDKNSSGTLLAMIIYNASQVAAACTDAITNLVQSICMVIGLIIVMFNINWQLSLVFFVFMPIMAIAIKMSSKRLRYLNRYLQDSMGTVTHGAEEAIEGYKVVRMFGGEVFETDRFEQAVKRNLSQELKIIMTKSISTSSVQLLGVCGLAGMIYLGTTQAMQAQLTAGGFTAMLAAMMSLLKPLKDLTSVNATIQRGLAGAESIFELLDQPLEIDQGHYEVTRAQGSLAIHNLSFHYPDMSKPVLTAINFEIPAGQTVALVGRSGSGKSSLASLLPRFYDYQDGLITLDGVPITEYQLINLRQQFAIVSQHTMLFNDTIANNIAYGKLGHSVERSDVEQAAIAAHAMEFIDKLPQGLDTVIGENGVLLSGGQRQRIAIARAILKDAPILILDEATSALDTESERYIQAALETIIQNRTTLVIAHRLSTIEKADRIIVLDQGRIVEQGTHNELLQRNGHYSHYYRLQFSEAKPV